MGANARCARQLSVDMPRTQTGASPPVLDTAPPPRRAADPRRIGALGTASRKVCLELLLDFDDEENPARQPRWHAQRFGRWIDGEPTLLRIAAA